MTRAPWMRSTEDDHPSTATQPSPAAPHAVEDRIAAALTEVSPPAAQTTRPTTLAIDVGGTGLKASVLDATGVMLVDRVRVRTPYPCPPSVLVETLVELASGLPAYDRISVGFPGMVRGGKVLTAPNLATVAGPGTKVSEELVAKWRGFDLVSALEKSLGSPARLANDADLQGMDVVTGSGLELVITLGTGLGTAVFMDGRLAPHLEMAHQPFRKGETYNEQVGDLARQRIGNKRWSRRVAKAVRNLDVLLCFDRLYVGGGNAGRLTVDLGPRATIVDNKAGILGGIRLWEQERG
jgi:polyphosphate glucokinase